jgi:hypothetical protein
MPVQDYNPKGGGATDSKRPLDPNRCKAGVHYYIGNWPKYKQCENKAKADGYCGTHNPEKVAARDKANDERGRAKMEADTLKWVFGRAGLRMGDVLAKIRDGDNDPRATAREILEAVDWDRYNAMRKS